MNYGDLNKAIKSGKIPPLLLLFGEENFFVEAAVRLVCDAAVSAENRDFNLSIFHGRGLQTRELLEEARTFPVFSPRRLILLKNVEEVPTDQLEDLIPYLDDPVPETVLLVTGGKLDARRKFFKRFKEAGAAIEFKRIYDNQLPSIIKDLAGKRDVTLTADALQLFCKRVGTNLSEANGELEKLISYAGEGSLIEEDDVAAVVSDSRIESVFDLTDALGEGHRAEALRLLGRLLEDGQAPLMVLAMLSRHFRQLWKARELVARDASQKEISSRVGISPYFLKGLIRQSTYYGSAEYRLFFEKFLETDLALKSSGGDPRILLEGLILTICGATARR